MNPRSVVFLLAFASLAGFARGQSAGELQSRFESLHTRVTDAAQTLESSPANARTALLSAAGELEALASSPLSIPDQAAVLKELGDAAFLAGDFPRGILAYRRALLLAPASQITRNNLNIARNRIRNTPASAPQASKALDANTPQAGQYWPGFDSSTFKFLDLVDFASHAANFIPPTLWLIATSTGLSLIAVFASTRLVFRRWLGGKPSFATALTLFILGGAGFALGGLPALGCHDVVVVARDASSFANLPESGGQVGTPVPAGAEFTLVETRDLPSGKWLGVVERDALPEAATIWIPAAAAETVVPK